MIYPGYMSFKAVKRNDVVGQSSWLKYWLVFSVLAAVGLILDSSPLYYKLPLYVWLKVGAIAYLVLPQTQGYRMVYDRVLEPQLHRHEANIDKAANDLYKHADNQFKNIQPKVNDVVQQTKGLLQKGMGQKGMGQKGLPPKGPKTS